MIKNSVSINVPLGADEAYAFLTNVGRWPEWMESVTTAALEGDFAAGGRIVVDYTEGVQATMQIERAERPSGYSYRVEMPDMAIDGTMRFADGNGTTTITYDEQVEPRSFMMKLMKPFIAKSVGRALEKDFARARELMEAER